MASAATQVCVIGMWHLGSVTAACLAHLGYQVIGVDKDSQRVADLDQGKPPLFEPGLPELIAEGLSSGRLRFTTELGQAINGSQYVLICFDTRVDEQDEPDLSEILDTCAEIARYLEEGATVIVSSQVPVGTCERIKSIIQQGNSSRGFHIACCPENLRLGQAIERFLHPDRIVIGADSPRALDKAASLFQVISAPQLRMNLKTAEMVKHALNAFMATSISFINELANLCDRVGADAVAVAQALASDERIGPKLPLKPGLGFAGGTLARDLKALQAAAARAGCNTYLIDAVLRINQEQIGIVARKLEEVYGSLAGLTVGFLGLTYKPGTSTLRRSAALQIIGDIVSKGARVKAYDPKASPEEVEQYRGFEFHGNPYSVAQDSHALVLTTAWPEFMELDYDAIKGAMKTPILIDAINILDKEKMLGKGFRYLGVGRG
ncbi:MAG TPA: UDP-glucose/GDP-mannose dehydrogenase family protein [Dehalococcoidia bacterium]|nr:UDP-glucose/GDP-mannose dehydrogenase family protein [Dehalococcoidia bacterium]